MRTVAIVGAGPGGLVAARYLKKERFEPVVFEQGGKIGGQWTGDARYSGIWPSMRTNTSRVLTAFSDLQHEPFTNVYPTNQVIRAYLQRYAEGFNLIPHIRLNTTVQEIREEPDGPGWAIRFQTQDGETQTATFSNVIVASGRYNKPMIPDVPGLSSFTGAGGVTHTFNYKEPERYRSQRVLVVGCSISALEIASNLALLGAARVVSTNRRQRYVLHKLLAGVPADHLAFTRFSALAEEYLPPVVVAQGLKDFVTRTSGSPEQFGAPKPADNVFEAGITQCQNFLPLVAEGHIASKPWIKDIEGDSVRFIDGSAEQVDAIIFGTGFDLHIPFLSSDLQGKLSVDAHHIDLHKFTFHPNAAGLAFLGFFELIGPYFPVLELQARWIAYVWSGVLPAPSRKEMEAGLKAYRARRGSPQQFPMHTLAVLFAREAGVEPELYRWPALARELLFGPLTPISFRLNGPDSLPDAPQRVEKDARTFGAVPKGDLTSEQRLQLQALAAACKDASFTRYVEQVTSSGTRDSTL
jgi:dimethylaniline monooxygenase (N-oxide forming)